MSKGRRIAIWLVTALAVGIVAVCVTGIFVLRSQWLSNLVRLRTVAAIERATGGRVDLRSFHFDWSSLTAEFQDLVVHGTEPPSAPPMFETPSIRITFPLTALLRRQIVIQSMRVDRPQIYLLVRPDGSTNMPQIRNGSISMTDLLSLQIGSFAFHNGSVRTDVQRIPLEAQGRNLSLLLRYAQQPAHYQIQISCNQLGLDVLGRRSINTAVDANVRLENNRIDIRKATIDAAASQIQAQGVVQRFNDPVVDLDVKANLAAAGLANFGQLRNLSSGTFAVNGAFHYDSSRPANFTGHLVGEHATYRFPIATLTNTSFTTDVNATVAGAFLTNIHVRTGEGSLSAKAQLTNWKDFSLSGNLERGDLRGLFALFTHKTLVWSGIATGPLTLHSAIDGHDFNLETRLGIVQGRGPDPVAGNVDLGYRNAGKVLQLNAQLASTKTRASISGTVGQAVTLHLDTTAISEIEPVAEATGHSLSVAQVDLTNSEVRYDGELTGPLRSTHVNGDLLLRNFGVAGQRWDEAMARFTASASQINVASASFKQQNLKVSLSGSAELSNWSINASSKLAIQATVSGVDIRNTAARYASFTLPVLTGVASGTIRLSGTLDNPVGTGSLNVVSLDAFGQRLNEVQAAFAVHDDTAIISAGKIRAAPGSVAFSGDYRHQHGNWREGRLQLHIDGEGFPINSLSGVARLAPELTGVAEIHADTAFNISGKDITPQETNGRLAITGITYRNIHYGNVTATAATHGDVVNGVLTGAIRETPLTGSFALQLTPGNPLRAEIQTRHLDLQTVAGLLNITYPESYPRGFVDGKIEAEGLLTHLDKLHGNVVLEAVEVRPAASDSGLEVKNDGPLRFDFQDGTAHIQHFRLATREGHLDVSGSFGFLGARRLDLAVNGQLALQAFELLDPNVAAGGYAAVDATIRGPFSQQLSRLAIEGSLALHNGSFSLKGVANGLSAVNGVVHFNRDRASIDSLTAQSGGGTVALSGFINFGKGPLVYDLKADAQNVRLRYAGALSVTASASLHMTGTTENGLVSGSTDISRVVVSPDADLGGVAAMVANREAQASEGNDLLSGLQLDVRIRSSQNMELTTSLSRDVEADMDLRLRGTPGHPLLFGGISASQGDFRIFGARYSLNSAEITFTNPTRIEPVLDVDVQTITHGVTIDIIVVGTLNKLNLNYRSDPPLQTREIIALLTVGQAPSFSPSLPNAQPAASDVSALQAGANSVLGEAISPQYSGLSKLFGTTNIKINPLEQGISNTPQSRLTIEQQISPHATIIYVTNLAETSEQIFRFEYALTPQYSVVAIRDDNGEFGIDFQYKKRFK
ncbi:MAG TPA: translocation/assembly module TamB domain-containing protein [Bryobacteraceae bacterium]|jgi:translocation and assembly module TamB|nr:translocation/assembly module TamB domain-containing protein [Bryobacteraceae bacterium]